MPPKDPTGPKGGPSPVTALLGWGSEEDNERTGGPPWVRVTLGRARGTRRGRDSCSRGLFLCWNFPEHMALSVGRDWKPRRAEVPDRAGGRGQQSHWLGHRKAGCLLGVELGGNDDPHAAF